MTDAVSKGTKIIVDVSNCFNDSSYLSNVVANEYLLRLTKQNNYVVCSKVEEYKDIRSADELLNICKYLGFSKSNKFKTYCISIYFLTNLIELANFLHTFNLNSFLR